MTLFFTLLKLLVLVHLGNGNILRGNRPVESARAETRDVLIGEDPDFECPGYGAWPHPERCELYYTCYFGEPTYVWQCRQDYLFDLVYYGCNFPELTECGDRLRPGEVRTSTVSAVETTTVITPPTDPSFTCPQDNGFFPADPSVCQSVYYVCVSNIPYIQNCPGNSVFDPNYLTCVPPEIASCGSTTTTTQRTTTTTTAPTTTTTDPSVFVCPNDNGLFPIRPEACTSSYYRCTDGKPYPAVCPNDYIFDPSQSRCVPPDQAICNNPDFTCPTSGGFYPYGDCSEKYYVCVSGEAYIAVCPEGSLFDPDRGVCVSKEQVPCYANSTTSTARSTTAKITQPPTPGGNFTCPEPNGYYPDPEDCHNFYVCAWGTPYLKVCPGDLYYNPEIEVCDYQQNVPSCVNGVPTIKKAGRKGVNSQKHVK